MSLRTRVRRVKSSSRWEQKASNGNSLQSERGRQEAAGAPRELLTSDTRHSSEIFSPLTLSPSASMNDVNSLNASDSWRRAKVCRTHGLAAEMNRQWDRKTSPTEEEARRTAR